MGEMQLLVTMPTCWPLSRMSVPATGRPSLGERSLACGPAGDSGSWRTQTHEQAGDGVMGVHAGDDFLADVAAFRDGDGTGIPVAGLHGEVGVGDVDAVEGGAGFDAGSVEGGPANGAEGHGAPRLAGGLCAASSPSWPLPASWRICQRETS